MVLAMSKIEEDRQEIRERILFFLYRNSYWQKDTLQKLIYAINCQIFPANTLIKN
jgi:hypothetical protein